MGKDYYAILGVSKDVSPSSIAFIANLHCVKPFSSLETKQTFAG